MAWARRSISISPQTPRHAHRHGGGHRSAVAHSPRLYGSSATETAFLYCCLTTDLVANPGGDSLKNLSHASWPITALIGDRYVPLWQLAMSGLLVTENQGLSWCDAMRALLYAQHPRYEWSTRPGVRTALDKPMIRKISWP